MAFLSHPDETAREVGERQALPAGGLRERFDQQRPITVLRRAYSFFGYYTDQISAQTTTNDDKQADSQKLRATRGILLCRAERATDESEPRVPVLGSPWIAHRGDFAPSAVTPEQISSKPDA